MVARYLAFENDTFLRLFRKLQVVDVLVDEIEKNQQQQKPLPSISRHHFIAFLWNRQSYWLRTNDTTYLRHINVVNDVFVAQISKSRD